jgi:hypothetical protein
MKKRYIVDGKSMKPADLKQLHEYLLDMEVISVISDEMRVVVGSEWPELVHKLPPKTCFLAANTLVGALVIHPRTRLTISFAARPAKAGSTVETSHRCCGMKVRCPTLYTINRKKGFVHSLFWTRSRASLQAFSRAGRQRGRHRGRSSGCRGFPAGPGHVPSREAAMAKGAHPAEPGD